MLKHSTTIAIEGTVITCPTCKDRIGTLRKTLYQGWTFGLDAIRFEPRQQPRNNQAACRLCGTSYAEIDTLLRRNKRIQTMLVHTDHGWLPKPPPDAPAPHRSPLKPAA